MTMWRHRPLLGYGLAVVLSGAALALRLVADEMLPPGFPYLTFFPAVVITAFVAGTGPGAVASVLSFFAAWYFFVPPLHSFALPPGAAAAQGFFALVVVVDVALIAAMHRANDRLHAEQQRTAALYDRQKMLFQELQHRVANSMTFVASILHFQKRLASAEPARAVGALDEAQQRIGIMARVHRRLYDPAAVDRPLAEHFAALCADVIAGSNRADIRCETQVAPVQLDLTRLIALSLFVSELVTNSLKHAFADRPAGCIRLTLAEEGAMLVLTLADDGRGLPPDYALRAKSGIGTRIVEGLAAQLRGTLELGPSPEGGAQTRLSFPRR